MTDIICQFVSEYILLQIPNFRLAGNAILQIKKVLPKR